jgi:alkanesulfonate monooxygenase SsuD/methylene tetrahydromethanopterin reductase-like flavin-dependent oxidoreductase (luciferase family)
MRFGLTVPPFDVLADPRLLAELACDAEEHGWDGLFVWDHVRYREPVRAVTDPWIALAAIAQRTSHLVIGPMVTPLARRRPHIVARQAVAIDQLSGGRFVLGVGLGLDTSGEEFVRFGDETDPARRAEMLDEALDLLAALWAGRLVDHQGGHYRAADVRFAPTPVRGHIPVWVAARWPHRRPLRRAARFDGVFAIDLAPDQLVEAIAVIEAARGVSAAPFDVVVHDLAGADPGPWAAAGATWLLTTFDPFQLDGAAVRAVVRNGPPQA